ncbi:MAG TPA: hemerythrin domain-containing protein [Solirubrobacteraceae bacterium]|nr:hemerythrin domain-containing protein [Solirubrobacteraceae bacterium]
MRRSDSLAPLSRDHHQALVAAQRLRRATPEDAAACAAAFLRFWDDHGRRHFVIEEELLLPELAPRDGAERAEVVRTLVEHNDVRRRALALRRGGAGAAPAALHALGELLAAHVRFEERELFALLEEELDAGALARLGEAVAVAAAAHAPTGSP